MNNIDWLVYVHKLKPPVIPASNARRESFCNKIQDKPEGLVQSMVKITQ